jgi:hypothetical protein
MDNSSLWVIITGLGTLVGVDAENPRFADMVLFRPVPDQTKVPPSTGQPVPAHVPRLRVTAGGPDYPIREEVVLPWAPTSARLRNGGALLPLGRELEFPALKLKGVLTGEPKRLRFADGELLPIFVKESFKLDQIFFRSELNLTGAFHIETSHAIVKNKRVANGVLYRRSFDSVEAPVVMDGVTPYFPEEIAAGETGRLPVSPHEKNYVLWISNTAPLEHSWVEDFDRDFHLLYDWLVDQSVVRYVPMIPRDVIRNPPGQCMFAYAKS